MPKNIEFLVYLDADIICVNDPTSKLLETFSQINSKNSVVAAITFSVLEYLSNIFTSFLKRLINSTICLFLTLQPQH